MNGLFVILAIIVIIISANFNSNIVVSAKKTIDEKLKSKLASQIKSKKIENDRSSSMIDLFSFDGGESSSFFSSSSSSSLQQLKGLQELYLESFDEFEDISTTTMKQSRTSVVDVTTKYFNPSSVKSVQIKSLGQACNSASSLCSIGLQCNGVKCVGPASIGQSCTLLNSTFMCKTGSYCNCNSDDSVCTCVAEKSKGAACTRPNQCKGGLGCNIKEGATSGTCMSFFSLGSGGQTNLKNGQLFCQGGLILYQNPSTKVVSCQVPSKVPCSSRSDCVSSNFFPFIDPIFYSCTSNKTCAFTAGSKSQCITKMIPNSNFTNFYDNHHLVDSAYTYSFTSMCSFLSCMYAGLFASPNQSCDALFLTVTTMSPNDFTWANVGGACGLGVGKRCKFGSVCSYYTQTCIAIPSPTASNSNCTLSGYDGIVHLPNPTYSGCDLDGKLQCNKYQQYDETQPRVPVGGKCVYGSGPGSACSITYAVNTTDSEIKMVTETGCNIATNVTCNAPLNSVSYFYEGSDPDYSVINVKYSGKCQKYGTSPTNTSVGSWKYCNWPLVVDPMTGKCVTLSTANIPCSSVQDCSDYFFSYSQSIPGADYNDDSHGGNDAYHYRWDLSEYAISLFQCSSASKCQYVGPSTCSSQYQLALTPKNHWYDTYGFGVRSNNNKCAFKKCILAGKVAAGFTLC